METTGSPTRQPELMAEISSCRNNLVAVEDAIQELTNVLNLAPIPAPPECLNEQATSPHYNRIQDRGTDIRAMGVRLSDCNAKLCRIIEAVREI